MAETKTPSVLFVCMGNICRSPTGEGVFRALIEKRGLSEHVTIDSAGTIGYHTGHPADARMREAARRRGYRLDSRARQVAAHDLEKYDLTIAMDRANYDDLISLAANVTQKQRVRMLGEFLPGSNGIQRDDVPDVPDPYYGGPAGFECVLDMIESACPAILDALLQSTRSS